MYTPTTITPSAWAAVPDRPALMEECRQRVSALGCIEDIVDWLRGIECPFTQEAMLRVFRDYWHDLESRLDDIAVWRSYNCCGRRFPGMDDTVAALIRLARERQDDAETSPAPTTAATANIAPVSDSHDTDCHNTDSHDTVYQSPVYQNSTVYNAPVTNNYYYNAPAPEEEKTKRQDDEKIEEEEDTEPACCTYIVPNDIKSTEEIEREMTEAARTNAPTLVNYLRTAARLGYIDLRGDSIKTIYEQLRAHFGFRYSYRNFYTYYA